MNTHKGFSLIELLVAVFIIGLLGTIIIPNYNTYTNKANRNSVKPTLSYIYNLFKLNYISERNFGGVVFQDVNVPEGHCIVSSSGSTPEPDPKIIGTCRSGVNKSCSTPSGFVVIAYGKKQKLDIGINHTQVFKVGKDATCKKLKGSPCNSYSGKGEGKGPGECRKAGCHWNLLYSKCETN